MGRVGTLTSKSQVTIPAEVRRRLGVGPGDRIVFDVEAGRATIRPLRGTFTEYLAGLGRDVWSREGGAARYLRRERKSWRKP